MNVVIIYDDDDDDDDGNNNNDNGGVGDCVGDGGAWKMPQMFNVSTFPYGTLGNRNCLSD